MNLLLDTHVALWAVEPMRLLSHDANLARYGELVVPV
jgi:PIN domain nuclease of toxin-antitoxin system